MPKGKPVFKGSKGRDSSRAAKMRNEGQPHGYTPDRAKGLNGAGVPKLPGQDATPPPRSSKRGRKGDESESLGKAYRRDGLKRLPKSMPPIPPTD